MSTNSNFFIIQQIFKLLVVKMITKMSEIQRKWF